MYEADMVSLTGMLYIQFVGMCGYQVIETFNQISKSLTSRRAEQWNQDKRKVWGYIEYYKHTIYNVPMNLFSETSLTFKAFYWH